MKIHLEFDVDPYISVDNTNNVVLAVSVIGQHDEEIKKEVTFSYLLKDLINMHTIGDDRIATPEADYLRDIMKQMRKKIKNAEKQINKLSKN